jgi:phosphatidylserine/phosphatidylglycerophosphate/cardiolipin synthase-like enzyme
MAPKPEDFFVTADDGAAIGASKDLFARVPSPTRARVETILGTEKYFAEIHGHLKGLASAGAPGDYLFIAGPMIESDLAFIKDDASSRLLPLLVAALGRKVEIRLLLSGHPEKTVDDSGRNINHLKAFTDKKISAADAGPLPKMGAIHNERVVVVFRGGERTVYCGGPELVGARRGAWHVAIKLVGPAAAAVDRLFRERWSDSSKRPKITAAEPVDGAPPADARPVQLLRTLSAPPPRGPKKAPETQFKFAPRGEFSGMAAIKKAITQATSYVYLEDPYFTSLTLAHWLGTSLARNAGLRVIVVVPKAPERIPTVYGYWKTRAIAAVRALAGANQGNFAVCHLEQPAGTALGCASRVVLVDDVWASVGSIGASRRSLTVNTEMAMAIADATQVKSLRIDLWKAHLGDGPGAEPDVAKAFATWKAGSGRALPHDPKGPEYKEGTYETSLTWLAIADPLGWAPFQIEDHLNPDPGALHPWVQANLELGARLLEATKDGRLKLNPPYDQQVQELAAHGSYEFRQEGKQPAIRTLYTPEAIRLLDALLAAQPKPLPGDPEPMHILSLLRRPDTDSVNHGRWLPKAKNPADVIRDNSGREVRGIGTAVDVARFQGETILLRHIGPYFMAYYTDTKKRQQLGEFAYAQLAKQHWDDFRLQAARTLTAVEGILKALPPGLYDLGLPRPKNGDLQRAKATYNIPNDPASITPGKLDPKKDKIPKLADVVMKEITPAPREELTVYIPVDPSPLVSDEREGDHRGPQSSPVGNLKQDIPHIRNDDIISDANWKPRDSFQRGLDGNTGPDGQARVVDWSDWKKLDPAEAAKKVVIFTIYPDADDHLHITAFRADEDVNMKGKWKADNAIFMNE